MNGLGRLAGSRGALAAAAVALAAVLFMTALGSFPRQPGIDFYQFWGVPLARDAGRLAQTPYVDPPAYARVLNALADSSASPSLRGANQRRRDLEPMGTPALYAAFSVFPADYDRAHALFAIAQYAAALAALLLLGRLRGLAPLQAWCVALAVLLTFNPFAQDVRVGNVNSFQLLAIAALVGVASHARWRAGAWIDGLFLAAFAALVAIKPNTPWIALALALHYAAARGARAFAIGAAEAAAAGVLAFAIGAAYFGGTHAWLEWIRFARGMDGSGLALGLAQGNVSVAMALAGKLPVAGSIAWGLVLGAALVGLLARALRAPDGIAAGARRAFADPWLAASTGVLLTFATSPLVWPHYHMLLLVPIAWLARPGVPCRACTWGAAACYGVLSRPFIDLLAGLEAYTLLQACAAASWIALLPGLLAQAARAASQREAPA